MRFGTSTRVSFPAHALDGTPQEQTGLLHVPLTDAPKTGYPVVVYGHMTTGGGPRSAPSLGDRSHPEWRRMSQGDVLCAGLLERGIAVLRPDYEGIGGPGVHPHLIGASLGASMRDMMAARWSLDERLGDDWVAAGHSEGSLAALYASVADEPDDTARLRGTSVFAPVTRMDVSIGFARRLSVRMSGWGVLPALMGLMLRGAATSDPQLAELVAGDGLSPRARELWQHLDERTLTELSRADSWGQLAPSAIGGPREQELYGRLFASFRANDIRNLVPDRAPVRIDTGRVDQVAPAALTRTLIASYRRAGVPLTERWWPTHHAGIMHARHAPTEAVGWIAERFEAR
ncbi:lipase family protein [Salinibacterium sp. ZJ70]|uniref:lipase family protein n=1 Tax=Salinibacterium sp. ZJ70 TaxID=2708084 RepID=UPI00141F656B|nr:lipase family protein [Salinibacterium sp. ZJ70]